MWPTLRTGAAACGARTRRACSPCPASSAYPCCHRACGSTSGASWLLVQLPAAPPGAHAFHGLAIFPCRMHTCTMAVAIYPRAFTMRYCLSCWSSAAVHEMMGWQHWLSNGACNMQWHGRAGHRVQSLYLTANCVCNCSLEMHILKLSLLDMGSCCRMLWSLAFSLSGIAAALWLCAAALQQWVQPASRRACNATYVVWSLALNLAMLLCFMLIDAQADTCTAEESRGWRIKTETSKLRASKSLQCLAQSSLSSAASLHSASVGGSRFEEKLVPRESASGPDPLPLLLAINAQLLSLFLFANLLTGSINAMLDTQAQSLLAGLIIVVLYMVIAITAATLLQ